VTTISSVPIVLMELLENGHAFKDGFTTRRSSPLHGSIPLVAVTKQSEDEGQEQQYPRFRLILNVRKDGCIQGVRSGQT
jgi:hypothetical protein